MIFNYPNGQTQERTVSSRLHGIKLDGVRPDTVSLTRNELTKLALDPEAMREVLIKLDSRL